MNIIDFAKAAGVSTATISRAFHEPDKVRPQTRDRILALAAKLHYYPDPSGRALVTGRHDALGVVWPLEVEGSEAPFAQRFLSSLTQVLVRHDLDLLICPVDRRVPATMAHARRTLLRSRCDAWVLLYPRRDDTELMAALATCRKPVVCLMGSLPVRPDWRSVQLSQHGWMADALRRLRKAGARRVLFIGGRPGEQDHAERAAAFRELAPRYFDRETEATGAEARSETAEAAETATVVREEPHTALCAMPGDSLHPGPLPAAGWRSEVMWPAGPEDIMPLLYGDFTPDAILAVDDSVALAALQACRKLGLQPGRRGAGGIQIIGIDDTPAARLSAPTLATYRQPLARMAATAVELALGKLHTAPAFEPEFVPGETLDRAGWE
ncbi:hypothetical protein DB346_00090 [Verrucomicrobia bacterium LW23]|nr:hypothetical protein DB346_00090 [Verrucomicrobia bacterium LW23]